eukprot:GILI01002087.1.p1 GENE.GILI01002087.1~~GILI01002087.1.p1  ORF type:complete len:468 (+),score=158.10 GILI01002087.1:169-1572(+)
MPIGSVEPGAAVVSLSELDRIRTSIRSADSILMDKQREKEILHQKSMNRVKNWGNTIEALRQKKEEERIRRLERLEEERLKVDREEEAIQLDKKRKAIERANKLLHDDQDRVKSFHSKLLLSDVMQEREYQVDLKQRKKNYEKKIDHDWFERDMESLRIAEQEEREKQERMKKKSEDIARIQKEQLYEFKLKTIKGLQEEQHEGELIKRKVIEDIEAEKRKEQARRERAKQAQMDTMKANEVLKKIKEKEQVRIQREEDMIDEYARKKEEVLAMRRKKEEEKFREKQAARQKIIDAQIERLAQMIDTENTRIAGQVQEAEAKANAELERRRQRFMQMEAQIERSRQKQIAVKKAVQNAEQEDAKNFAEFWRQRNKEIEDHEEEERRAKVERNKELANFLKEQADQKKHKYDREKVDELMAAERAKDMSLQEELKFNSYAEQMLQTWSDMGKNVKPLILELKNYKKRS